MRDPSILSTVKELALRKPMYGIKDDGRPPIQGARATGQQEASAARVPCAWMDHTPDDEEPGPEGSQRQDTEGRRDQSALADRHHLHPLRRGRVGYLFNVLDAYSREWVAYVFDPLAKKENAIRAVVNALERHPDAAKTVTLYSDNGPHMGAMHSSSRWTRSASGTGS